MRPRPALRALLCLLACACALAACVPRHRAPAAGARLSVGAESFVDDGPFRVVFAGPRGEAASPREVTISFSRPMHALSTLEDAPAEARGPAAITLADSGAVVPGTWRWFGERTAVFWPKTPFAPATAFRVVVDETAHAIDGSTLSSEGASDRRFTFTSARPDLEDVSYQYDEALDEHLVTLSFTQSVDHAEVRRAIRIAGKTAAKALKEVPFHVIGEGPDSTVRLHVDRSIARLEGVTVVASPSLRGAEGPLPANHETSIAVEGVGPLRATIVCRTPDGEEAPGSARAHCGAEGYVELRLSDSVATRDLASHLVVAKPAKLKLPDDSPTTNFVDLSSQMNLTAGGKYRITLKAGLRTANREITTEDQVLDFDLADQPPSLTWRDIGREAVVESARPSLGLRLWTMNVPAFDAVRAPLDDASLADVLLGRDVTTARIRALPGSAPVHVDVNGGKTTKNEGARAAFELPADMRAPGASGVFAVATSARGLPDDVRVLSVTDLGVTTKWSPHGGLVWVTRLSTGAPVPNANLSLVRAWRPAPEDAHVTTKEAFATKTNADGLAEIPSQVAATFLSEDAPSEALVFVQNGADRTYARLPQLDPHADRVIGDLFTERRLYRPGETMYVKGLFRSPTPRGLVSLVGLPATLEVFDGEEHLFFTTSTTLDAFGSFACEVPIPRGVRLGRSSMRARVGAPPARTPSTRHRSHWAEQGWPARASFTVDELRAVEFEVTARADRESGDRDQATRFTASGRYLVGAAMHGVPVELSAMRSQATFRPPGLEGFVTDPYGLVSRPSSAAWSDAPKLPRDVKLGADGSASVVVPLALSGQIGPETLRLDASIADVSGAFASGDSASVLVHATELYVGVRPKENSPVIAGKTVRAEILAASVGGTRRAGVPVHVELLHDVPNAPVVVTGLGCEVRTAEDVTACEIPVAEAGSYWLRASAKDARGRAVLAAIRFYAMTPPPPSKPPPPPPPPAPPPPPPRPFDEACRDLPGKDDFRSISVAGDYWDRRYTVGTTAHVCLRGSGPSLLTFEREGVLRHEIRRLGLRGTLLDVPITADLAPNAVLALRSVSGRDAPFPSGLPERADHGHPGTSLGSVALHVTAPDKKLVVAIDTEPEYRPGTEVVTRVRVADASGQPARAQVTVWAVDEGVLLLEPYRVPDLAERLTGERGVDVVDADTRDLLLWEKIGMHTTRSPSIRQGATMVGPGDHFGRTIFRPTAWFAPSVVTGIDGVATVKAKLPDNLTTWKVFAVAMTVSDGFGSAESSFKTNKPLMARPQLPRFLRVGDHVDATMIIDSLSKEPLDVKVSMRAAGAVASSGATVTSLVVPPEGHVPVRFSLDAKTAGHGTVTFHVEAPRVKLVDDVTVDQDVAAVAPGETIVISGVTKGRADERMGDLSRARDDVGGLDFRLATSPMVGLAESLTQLVEYPYGCTEQLTSRLVPLVRLRALARDLEVALPKDVDGATRTAIGSLLSHQRSDGGFGFWPASRVSEPWLTVLALGALQAARESGFAVPPAPLERASTYLERAEGLDAASRAMLEDLFASAGRPREKELRALAAPGKRGKLPLFARALVARALAKVDRALGLEVLREVASQARLSGASAVVADEATVSARRHISSDARTTAMVLRAFVALEPDNALVPKLVRGLLSLRKDGRWLTTQASAWALVALDEARPLFAASAASGSSATTARLSLDGAEIAKATFAGAGGARGAALGGMIPMTRLSAAPGATLSFTTDGAPLYYEGALRYARREPPQKPLESGIYVTRSMRLLRRDAEPAAVSAYHVGDYVEVDVMLSSPVARDLVVLDDPIPAGFEAVNQRFANRDRQPFLTDPSTHHVTHRELRDDRVVTFFDELPAGQLRTSYVLRVVSGGTYAVPPTKAECMYAPDVFGRTAASVVVAKP